jgi:hypothetical protein
MSPCSGDDHRLGVPTAFDETATVGAGGGSISWTITEDGKHIATWLEPDSSPSRHAASFSSSEDHQVLVVVARVQSLGSPTWVRGQLCSTVS